MAGLLSSIARALSIAPGGDGTKPMPAMERYGPAVVAALLAIGGAGYLFGYVPLDRVTALVGILGAALGGAFIRHQA